MKWFSILSILALAFLANACEKHPTKDAPEEGKTEFGPNSIHAEEKAETKPASETAVPAKPESPAATPEAKPGEAPKFFPEKK
ncbi:MAG: hypothetical protein ABJF10_22160 [Chthoniobacter sp.]|uniref:hypothetical protein n=1 Tax=Chthoniobacter sp. TaxID=2510640 RepID=UPI0032A31535